MKILSILTVLAVAFFRCVPPASAQVYIVSTGDSSPRPADNPYSAGRQQEYISTAGTAEIRVVPDLVDLHFEILVRNHDFEAARKEHADRAARVLAALRAAGVKEEDLQTSQTKIQSKYVTERNQDTAAIDYFQIAQDFNCTLHDPARVTPVTGAVLTAGATGVSEAQLRTSQLRKYRDEARHKAAVAAREKATALAAEIGKKLGQAISIREGSYSPGSQSNIMSQNVSSVVNNGGPEDSDTSFAPGLITVGASVDVTYVLVEE